MKITKKYAVKRPVRRKDSHKGENGQVLVIGGSEKYVGAPALAGLASLRAGCDIVRIAAPEKVAWAINTLTPDLITEKLPGKELSARHCKKIAALAEKSDVVLIGPGLGNIRAGVVNNLLKKFSKMNLLCVVDADALKLAKIKNLRGAIITPHTGEFEIFLRNSARKKKEKNFEKILEAVRDDKLSEKKVREIRRILDEFFSNNNVLLLKGPKDLIISKNQTFVSKGGNAGMTVGGTGDVLAGICAGYLAQTKSLFDSAVLASQECKRIGEVLEKRTKFGFGFIASDFLEEIINIRTR
jgi:NAD(P)H-hydrate epimerase